MIKPEVYSPEQKPLSPLSGVRGPVYQPAAEKRSDGDPHTFVFAFYSFVGPKVPLVNANLCLFL